MRLNVSQDGYTGLMAAAQCGQLGAVRLHLERGANVNAARDVRSTPPAHEHVSPIRVLAWIKYDV